MMEQDTPHNLLEHGLIIELISLSYEPLNVRFLCQKTLLILNKHPLLKKIPAAIWEIKNKQLRIMSVNGINFQLKSELKTTAPLAEDSFFFQAKVTTLANHPHSNIVQRLDICLGSHEHRYFFLSFWFATANPFASLTLFLKSYLSIYHLSLLNILYKKRDKLLKTILEKMENTVEIMNTKAVIQYEDPSFEEITRYQAEEVRNKTVASLLRTEIEG